MAIKSCEDQKTTGQKSRHDIVANQTEGAGHVLLEQTDWPGPQDIDQSKENKRGQHPDDGPRDKREGDQTSQESAKYDLSGMGIAGLGRIGFASQVVSHCRKSKQCCHDQ